MKSINRYFHHLVWSELTALKYGPLLPRVKTLGMNGSQALEKKGSFLIEAISRGSTLDKFSWQDGGHKIILSVNDVATVYDHLRNNQKVSIKRSSRTQSSIEGDFNSGTVTFTPRPNKGIESMIARVSIVARLHCLTDMYSHSL